MLATTIQPEEVPFFGIHYTNDTPFLFQDLNQRGFDFRGKQADSGKIASKIQQTCPHAINMYQAKRSLPKVIQDKLVAISQDPLFLAMCPFEHTVKNGKVFSFSGELMLASLWLKSLERLCSPKFSQVFDLGVTSVDQIKRTMKRSNIHPVAVYGIRKEHALKVQQLVIASRTAPATLVLVGEVPELPNVVELETKLSDLIHLNDLVNLPLEHFGTRIIDKLYNQGLFPWE